MLLGAATAPRQIGVAQVRRIKGKTFAGVIQRHPAWRCLISPAAVPAGIVRRFRDLVKRIKATKNYTETIGQALGITVGA